jgi:hypothetical protein
MPRLGLGIHEFDDNGSVSPAKLVDGKATLYHDE